MYLVIRGDRLYEGYSIVYTTKSGKKSTKGCKEEVRTQSGHRENKAAPGRNSEETSLSSVCRRAGALLRKLHPQTNLE